MGYFKKNAMSFKFQVPRSKFQGFTLIEMVVALGIFLVASTAATSIFVSANKASRRTVGITRIGSDARWAMEKMVEDIRLGTVDYAAIISGTPTNFLSLRTIDGQMISYSWVRQNNSDVCGAAAISCIVVSYNNGIRASMTPKGIDVRRLDFYVWPPKDPFVLAGDGRTVGQPRVTIVFETETIGSKKEEQSRLSLQTTVSTRVYKR